ncbi:MAG: polymer-forming cytoskeletal protein [Pseudomonadota bacterium]|nr:polymer-forming cytoskeletal protein [Pseudomonadota bacterium]
MKKPPERPLAALLGRGAQFGGDLSFEGRVRVDGTFKGRIFTEDVLEIGEHGAVDGEIDASVLIVAGTASGNVRARERLVLEATGLLKGQVESPMLEVHPGGRIDAVVRVVR